MIVVKYGGNAMSDENGGFARAIAAAISEGAQIVIVHGGGPQINDALAKAGITSQWAAGLRVTQQESFDIVEKVLVKEVGPGLVRSLENAGVRAASLSARTLPTVFAEKMQVLLDGKLIDIGLVGKVTDVDPAHILEMLSKGVTPVVAPISSSKDRITGLNVNADSVAAAIASSVNASALIIMTDVSGIYRNWPDESSLIHTIRAEELESIKDSFNDGMSPKVQATLDALAFGVKAVRIIDGTKPETLAKALAGQGGTLVSA
jgi:acetylglutamate kinase